jgi:hypothetical protein
MQELLSGCFEKAIELVVAGIENSLLQGLVQNCRCNLFDLPILELECKAIALK